MANSFLVQYFYYNPKEKRMKMKALSRAVSLQRQEAESAGRHGTGRGGQRKRTASAAEVRFFSFILFYGKLY